MNRRLARAARRVEDGFADAAQLLADRTVARLSTVVASVADEVWGPDWWQDAVDTHVAGPLRDFTLLAGQQEAGRMGVAFGLVNPMLQRTADRHLDYVGSWSDSQRAWLSDRLQRGLDEGAGVDRLAKELTEAGDSPLNPAAARRFAQTELIAAQNGANQATWQTSGLTGVKRWMSTPDEHTRPSHVAANGQERPAGGLFQVGGYQCQYPADPQLPGSERVNCVVGETPVSGNVTAAVLSRYDGLLVEVVTAGDQKLAASPNHPVLTRFGWRPVGSLQPGDEVLCATEAGATAAAVDPHVTDGVATAEEAARAVEFAAAGLPRRPAALVDLYGDVLDRQVEVVRADLPLTFGRYAEKLKQLGQLTVHGRHGEVRLADHLAPLLLVAESDAGRFTAAAGRQSKVVERRVDRGAAQPGRLGDLDHRGLCAVEAGDLVEVPGAPPGAERGSFVRRVDRHSGDAERPFDGVHAHAALPCDRLEGLAAGQVQRSGLGRDAFGSHRVEVGVDAAFLQACVDEGLPDPEPGLDRSVGHAGGVAGDDLSLESLPDVLLVPAHFTLRPIVDIRTQQVYNHPLYDLETGDGLFLAGGIIAHNCRCRTVFVPDDQQPPATQPQTTAVAGVEAAQALGRLDGTTVAAVEREALTAFQGGDWRHVNRWLAGGPAPQHAQRTAVTLVDLLYGQATAVPVAARRWWPPSKAAAVVEAGGVDTVGIVSYTLDDTAALAPQAWVTVVLAIPAGVHAAVLDGDALELLLPPGSRLKVLRVGRDGTVHLTVTGQTYPQRLIEEVAGGR